MNERVTTGIAVTIVVVWLTSFVLDATRPAYDPPEIVYALMMAVATYAFTHGVTRKRNGGKGDG